MAADDDLEVQIGITLRKLTQELAKAEGRMQRTAQKWERDFSKANTRAARSMRQVTAQTARVGRSLTRLAGVAAAALSVRQLGRYGDTWTRVGNKIKAAEQISGTAARSLSDINDIASRSRASLDDTADLYSRLLRVSGNLGASEREVAEATEITAKAFKAGGAAVSEQTAGILQLSQALSSGFLQGDELRSLRENAPLVAQAIADEFETTIGGLKALGAAGELTADRVFRAILNSQKEIEAAFSATVPTLSDSFQILQNGLVELVGGFNDGSGAAEGLSRNVASLGEFLAGNADAARRFGARVSEAITVASEGFNRFVEAVGGDKIAEGFGDAGDVIAEFGRFTVETIQTIVATASGVGAAIGQAMVRAVVAVADGSVAVVNAAITGVEALLNGVLNGIQAVIAGINNVISAANSISPVEVPLVPEIEDIQLKRISGIADDASARQGIGEAFQTEFDRVKTGLDNLESDAVQAFDRIKRAGNFSDEDFLFSQSVIGFGSAGSGSGGEASSGSTASNKRGGATAKAQNDALREAKQLFDETRTSAERYAAELEKLNALKEAGLIGDETYRRGLEKLKDEFSNVAEGVAGFADEIANAIISGEDLGEAFKRIIDGMVSDLISSSLKNLISEIFSGPSGGGGLGSIFGGLFGGKSFEGGGFTGSGLRSGGLDGRGGFPALLHPNETVIDHTTSRRSGVDGSRQTLTVNIHENASDGETQVRQSPGRIDVFLRKMVSEQIRGGGADSAMRDRFGMRPKARGA
jgi:tape measure domain-containing protein